MCLAIFKPASLVIPGDYLRNGWQGNSDGAGFAYIDGGKVVAQSGLMTLKDFIEAYDDATKLFSKSPFLIHFRIRSMGDRSAANTHPFAIPGGMLIHNGSIDGTKAEYSKGPSDTAMFAQMFGEHLTYDTVTTHKKDFDDALGYNKVVLLYDDGRHVIINEDTGVWDNDVWYSNSGYKTSRANYGVNYNWEAEDHLGWKQRRGGYSG